MENELHNIAASDFSAEALAKAREAYSHALDTYESTGKRVNTCDERVTALHQEVARLNTVLIDRNTREREGKETILAKYLSGTGEKLLPTCAREWAALSTEPRFLNAVSLHVGSELLPAAVLAVFEAQVELLFAKAESLKAEALVRVIMRFQAAQPLLELEGGTLELPPGGSTSAIVAQASEAFGKAAEARRAYDAEAVRQGNIQKQLR